MKRFSDVANAFPDYLTDESHLMTSDNAEEILFPESTKEVQEIVQQANKLGKQITISGGGTGIAAGRVPLSGWIVATDEMRSVEGGISWTDPETGVTYSYKLQEVDENNALLTVPVSITVKSIQNLVRELGWFYPPDPTERSAFIGGNFATNASGSRSFRYGPTRGWVQAAEIVLPDGRVVELSRDEPSIGPGEIEILDFRIPRPTYPQPLTTKNVAGPVITDDSKPIDLFIGTDGIFGIVTRITLRLIKLPSSILNIMAYSPDASTAVQLIQTAQEQRSKQKFPIPLSVEYLDERATSIMRGEKGDMVTIILEQETCDEDEMEVALEFWSTKFEELGIEDTSVAMTHKEIERHKQQRHLVPETVNSIARSNGMPKLGTDYAAPISMTEEIFKLGRTIGEEFEAEVSKLQQMEGKPGFAMWAHAGDAHVHLNLLPRDDREKEIAKRLMVKMMRMIVGWNGTIAAEHGLGKKRFDGEPALQIMIGDEGLEEIHRMKEILDPRFLLNRGNLIDP